jgi:EmrB/QacA subfamily drug resistance transporter
MQSTAREETQMSTTPRPYARRFQALVVLAAALLIVMVGNTILNVALPTLQEELDATSGELQWIADGYLLLFAGLLLTAGSLGDRFGRRLALVLGLVVFGLGSVAAALAESAEALIAARAVMGIGAAGIMPTTLSVITNIFPEDERPKAIAAWTAAAGLGVAIGPVAGGWLIENFDISVIFLVNVPAVLACLAGALLLVPESRDPDAARLDLVGAGLSIAALSALVWALIEAPAHGWTDSVILTVFGAGAAILAAFVWWERRIEHPMLDVSVFRDLRFSAANASITFVYFALMGVMYFLSTYLQAVLGLSALDAGLWMLPIAFGLMLTSRPSVALTRRFGTKVVVAVGLTATAGALLGFTGFGTDSGFTEIAAVLFAMGAGMGLAIAPATEAIMGSLPPERAGIGSAMNDVVREVAGTLGIAVLGSLLTSAYAGRMDDAVGGLPPDAATAASDSVVAAHAVAAEAGGSAAADLVAAADQAFVHAMSSTATIGAVVAVVGALIAAAFLPARARRASVRLSGEVLEAARA